MGGERREVEGQRRRELVVVVEAGEMTSAAGETGEGG